MASTATSKMQSTNILILSLHNLRIWILKVWYGKSLFHLHGNIRSELVWTLWSYIYDTRIAPAVGNLFNDTISNYNPNIWGVLNILPGPYNKYWIFKYPCFTIPWFWWFNQWPEIIKLKKVFQKFSFHLVIIRHYRDQPRFSGTIGHARHSLANSLQFIWAVLYVWFLGLYTQINMWTVFSIKWNPAKWIYFKLGTVKFCLFWSDSKSSLMYSQPSI